MSSLNIYCIGKLKYRPYREAADLYLGRLKHLVKLREHELKSPASSKHSEQQIKQLESVAILDSVAPATQLFVLDERGIALSSKAFAAQVEASLAQSQDLAFAIGGALGHDESLRKRANVLLSLSAMTLAHELARVLLYEQLYRAMTLIKNIPYHK